MSELSALAPTVLSEPRVRLLTSHDRLIIRSSNDVDTLVRLRAQLRATKAGRGRWLLWTWLLLLGGGGFTYSTTTVEPGLIFFLFLVAVVVIVLVVSYVSRIIKRADHAEEWLSEVDFRLAQLAAREAGA